MVLESHKCLICGKSLDSVQKGVFPKKHSSVFEAWKTECARATCEVLLGEKSDYFTSYFQNANYCVYCENLVRDICFTWKQIQSLQNRLENLSAKIVNRLDSNYENIKDKSHLSMVEEKISLILGTADGGDIPEYSCDEMIEVIYSVSSRAQLNNFPIRCWNINTSFFKNSKLHHVEGNLSLESDVIPTSSPVRIKKEEPSENEDCLQQGSLDYSTEENQSQIKIERSDSSQEKLNEKIVTDKFEEEHFVDGNYDEYSSPSGSEYDFTMKKVRKLTPKSGSRKGKSEKLQNEAPGDRKYKCDHCPKKYDMERKVYRHMNEVHYKKKQKYYYCTEENCKKRCISEDNLKVHIQIVHKGEKQPYKCEKCQKRFTIVQHLRRHMQNIHDKGKDMRVTDCSFCGKKYSSAEDLAVHYSNSHQEPNPFQCAFCPELYENTTDLKKHTKEVHCEVFKCSICGETFLSPSSLHNHETRVHKYTSVDCEMCGTVLPTFKIYRTHKCTMKKKKTAPVEKVKIKSYVPNKEKKNSDAPKYVRKSRIRPIFRYNFECKFCCKGYNEEEELNAHYTESHQGPNPFTCAFCPEICSNSVYLRKHMESIHPDPNLIAGKLKCETCNSYFASNSTLQLHSLSHVDPNLLFKCHLCPSVFKQRFYLNKHLDNHSGERKYICETCGKSYKNTWGLYRHKIIHDESRRKWKCKICDKKFFTRGHCMNHERTHINMKEFVCEICGRGFNLEVNMRQHMKIHKGLPTRRPRPPRLKSKS